MATFHLAFKADKQNKIADKNTDKADKNVKQPLKEQVMYLFADDIMLNHVALLLSQSIKILALI